MWSANLHLFYLWRFIFSTHRHSLFYSTGIARGCLCIQKQTKKEARKGFFFVRGMEIYSLRQRQCGTGLSTAERNVPCCMKEWNLCPRCAKPISSPHSGLRKSGRCLAAGKNVPPARFYPARPHAVKRCLPCRDRRPHLLPYTKIKQPPRWGGCFILVRGTGLEESYLIVVSRDF